MTLANYPASAFPVGQPTLDRPRRLTPRPSSGLRAAAVADARVGAETWRVRFGGVRRIAVAREVLISAAAGTAIVAVGAPVGAALWWALVLGAALPAAVAISGGYRWRTLGEGSIEARAVIRAGAHVAVALMAISYVSIAVVPTAVVAASLPAAVASCLAARSAARRSLLARRASGSAMLRTIIVGSGPCARELLSQVRRAPGCGYDVVGWCGNGEDNDEGVDVPSFGAFESTAAVASLVRTEDLDVVLLVGGQDSTTVHRMARDLSEAGASLVVLPSVTEISSSRVRIRPTGGLWTIQLDIAPRRRPGPAKAAIDRVAGAVLLALSLIVLLPVMVAVRLTSRGPALYRQQRIGRHGQPFTMWKVRTMYADADKRRAELLDRSDGNGLLFKMRIDPRITPVGRLLRRLSIDELPQLLNVVRGEMSLVGPRPALAEEVARYGVEEARRLEVKAGLTGLWQVSGRSDLSREQSIRLDLRYVDNWSLGLDAVILWRTAAAVAGGRGAY